MLPGLLTKKSTQEEITAATNASVLVRGRYTPPGDTSNSERPLHLHIEARTQEEIDRAVEMVHSLMGGPPSSATSTSTPTLVSPPPPTEASVGMEGATPLPSLNMAAPMPSPRGNAPQRPEMIRHTIDVGLDSNAGYQIRGKLLGPKGSYLKHIQDQTGVRVQLAGKTMSGATQRLASQPRLLACLPQGRLVIPQAMEQLHRPHTVTLATRLATASCPCEPHG
ncbi:MAG: hypothetical protein SGPRY_005726 [Prymnesium sp.]